MAHKCDNCGNIIDEGKEELLDGCGECGGRTFQFVSGNTEQNQSSSEDIIDGEDPVPTQDIEEDSAQSAARGEILTPDDTSEYRGSAGDLVSGLQSSPSNDEEESVDEGESYDENCEDEPPESTPIQDAEEDSEQAVDSEEDGEVVTDPTQLHSALSQEFESIKIIEQGKYELNLRKLYDREEHIIQIREDGKYVIQMPER